MRLNKILVIVLSIICLALGVFKCVIEQFPEARFLLILSVLCVIQYWLISIYDEIKEYCITLLLCLTGNVKVMLEEIEDDEDD